MTTMSSTTNANNKEEHSSKSAKRETTTGFSNFSAKWTRTIYHYTHEPYLKHVLHPTTQLAARNPKRTLLAVTSLTFVFLLVGLVTNFNVEVDGDFLWTPKGVRTVDHRNYVSNPQISGYDPLPRTFYLFVHRRGDNVVTRTAVQRLFEALDVIRTLPRYAAACTTSNDANSNNDDCNIQGVTRFWNNSATVYQAADLTTDEALRQAVSAPTFPDGVTVLVDDIFGLPVVQNISTTNTDITTTNATTQVLVESAQGLSLKIYFPRTDVVEELEVEAIDAMIVLAREWKEQTETDANDDTADDKQGTYLHLEVLAERSFDDEIDRAIVEDIPLVPIVFVVMGLFTATVFAHRRDAVHSQSLLGFTAVVSVLFSIMTGYGFMFMAGVNVGYRFCCCCCCCHVYL